MFFGSLNDDTQSFIIVWVLHLRDDLHDWFIFSVSLNDDAIEFGSPVALYFIIWYLWNSKFLTSNLSEVFIILIEFNLFWINIFFESIQRCNVIDILLRIFSTRNQILIFFLCSLIELSGFIPHKQAHPLLVCCSSSCLHCSLDQYPILVIRN